MSFGSPYLDDDFLTGGVMSRRCVAWVIDCFLIAMLVWVLWWILVMFGLLTLGPGFRRHEHPAVRAVLLSILLVAQRGERHPGAADHGPDRAAER